MLTPKLRGSHHTSLLHSGLCREAEILKQSVDSGHEMFCHRGQIVVDVTVTNMVIEVPENSWCSSPLCLGLGLGSRPVDCVSLWQGCSFEKPFLLEE